MPKRRPEKLTGIRLEINERERDLLEQAIIVNGISGVARGLGNAVGGVTIAAAIVAGVVVWKKGPEWIQDKLDLGASEWLAENCSQEKYDAYIQQRTDGWINAAKDSGRYAPAYGDVLHHSWWRRLDPESGAVEQALTFDVWEANAFPNNPPMLYDEWCNKKRAKETKKKRLLASTIFPPLHLVGIFQHGFKDWFSGTK